MKDFFAHIKRLIADTDKLLLFICLLTSAFGIVCVHSATLTDISEGSAISRDTRTMILAVSLGLVLAIIISLIDYNIIVKFWWVLAIICISLMILLFFIGVGPSSRSDAKTWISIAGGSLYFQPSELLKIGFIVTFSMHIGLVHSKINSIATVIGLCLHAAIPVVLVALSGDMGSALIFIFIFIGMMFMAGLAVRYFVIGTVVTAASIPFIWKFVLKDLQKTRFLALIHPDEYPDTIYQQKNCLTAIGAGKLTGMGLFNGTYTQSGLVPENENDMILSVVGEELGFVGCVLALGLLATIIIKIIHIGRKTSDNTAAMMTYGLSSMLLGHIIINVSMCLKLFPVVGITLPFFSAGGSSNLCIYIGIGLALSVYRHSREHEAIDFRLNGLRTPFTE